MYLEVHKNTTRVRRENTKSSDKANFMSTSTKNIFQDVITLVKFTAAMLLFHKDNVDYMSFVSQKYVVK